MVFELDAANLYLFFCFLLKPVFCTHLASMCVWETIKRIEKKCISISCDAQ